MLASERMLLDIRHPVLRKVFRYVSWLQYPPSETKRASLMREPSNLSRRARNSLLSYPFPSVKEEITGIPFTMTMCALAMRIS